MNLPAANTPPATTAAQWDEVRVAFHGSLLGEIALSTLAQNIDGCTWCGDDPAECPAAYIDLPREEVLARLAARGLPPSSLDELVAILRGTLSFDESFGEMLEIAGKSEARSDVVARHLERLGIPATFPVSLCALSPGTLDFCAREQILTVWDFLHFARGASRQVIIGGEFKDLLNAVTHIDEDTLATLLPYRKKTSGLHLVEALGLLLSRLGPEARLIIARSPAAAPGELRAEVARRIAYFSDQAAQLRAQLQNGIPLSRLVVSLDDLSAEAAVAALLGLYLTPTAELAPVPEKPFHHRSLFRWFRKH